MRISELIIRFIDWFYRKPVAAILPRQTFRYIVCGGANVVFSWVCYFLVYNFVLDKEQLDLGFVVVSAYVTTLLLIFPFTFFTGFWLNRYVHSATRRCRPGRSCSVTCCRSAAR